MWNEGSFVQIDVQPMQKSHNLEGASEEEYLKTGKKSGPPGPLPPNTN
jgi:hypothetical protein